MSAEPRLRQPWTDAEKAIAMQMWPHESVPPAEVCRAISPHLPGRSSNAVGNWFRWRFMAPAMREKTKARINAARTWPGPNKRVTPSQPADPAALAEMMHRRMLDAERTDITAILFGEPLPGYSAYDRKQQQR